MAKKLKMFNKEIFQLTLFSLLNQHLITNTHEQVFVQLKILRRLKKGDGANSNSLYKISDMYCISHEWYHASMHDHASTLKH